MKAFPFVINQFTQASFLPVISSLKNKIKAFWYMKFEKNIKAFWYMKFKKEY